MISPAARQAAEWWTDWLEQGDRVKFRERLGVLIQAALSDTPDGDDVIIKTDYDPDGMLLDALHVAGVECSGMMWSCHDILPVKTILRVNPARLLPKEGYGNWVDEIEVADAPIEEKIKEATRKMEHLLARQELERRWAAKDTVAIKEPPHCSECFEGCPRCQPVKQKSGPLSRARISQWINGEPLR